MALGRIGLRPKKRRGLKITPQIVAPPQIQSEYEWRVWKALTQLGYTPGIQQAFRGGTAFSGGMRVDFVLLELMTVVRVMSWYHRDPGTQQRDEYQKLYLMSLGYQVLDCWPERIGDVRAVMRWLRQNLGRPTA